MILKEYDIIIIGAGPAGLSAALYSKRYGLNSIVISKNLGGLAAVAHIICNFPTYKEIKGFELMQKFIEQVKELGVKIVNEEAKRIEKIENKFIVETEKEKFKGKKIIYAGGTIRKKLNIPNEEKFIGRGVSYCSTCDGPLFKDKKVIVVGGSDAALTSALLLSDIANEVSIIYRGNNFTKAEAAWIKLVENNKKIKKIFNEEVVEIIGKNKVEGVKLKSGKEIKIDGIFVEIGSIPETTLISNLGIKLDDKGYILTDKYQRTNVSGFFAAGDITNNNLKQIITAAAEGAVAAYSAYQEIKKEH
ncbi:MAG: FAD-dependent oxidoreductase [Candidatus Pacearchaeota archaeon]